MVEDITGLLHLEVAWPAAHSPPGAFGVAQGLRLIPESRDTGFRVVELRV